MHVRGGGLHHVDQANVLVHADLQPAVDTGFGDACRRSQRAGTPLRAAIGGLGL